MFKKPSNWEKHTYTGGILTMMEEHEIKQLIEKTVLEAGEEKLVERVQYIMDFGKVYIQYDFCLN